MKVLSLEEAKNRFAAVCQAAAAGELIRLRLADGTLIELTRVSSASASSWLSNGQLADCYEDQEWAEFENRCGKASD